MNREKITLQPLSISNKILLLIVSFLIVAFGQPAWNWVFGIVAATCGYALFWRVLLDFPSGKKRFWVATAWMTAIYLVQLSWFISHPYVYIYALWITLSVAFAAQFGVISLFIKPEKLTQWRTLFIVPALWVIFEWSRLSILSGYSWNPTGLALTGSTIALQFASLAGIFGLSFWIILVNLLALRAWVYRGVSVWLIAATLPFVYGTIHLNYHSNRMEKHENPDFSALLVQTSFPVEEAMEFDNFQHFLSFVKDEWRTILRITKDHVGKEIDLVALPEFVVPFGTYSFIYPYDEVKEAFIEYYGPESIASLPEKELPLATTVDDVWMVSNAFWIQGIANHFDSAVIAGLEDAEDMPSGEREFYSSAIYFDPNPEYFSPKRYAKRILVPMGEYIPFSFVKELAAKYGICGSFTCGQEAVAWPCNNTKLGVSICYEETFGDLMRENKEAGAELLLNITSDAWYPHSRLVWQHLDHARLRTVENGFPLIRACNTGITSAIDALGRNVALLAADAPDPEDIADSLHVTVSTYNYDTLYSRFGDGLIVGLSLLLTLLFFRKP